MCYILHHACGAIRGSVAPELYPHRHLGRFALPYMLYSPTNIHLYSSGFIVYACTFCTNCRIAALTSSGASKDGA